MSLLDYRETAYKETFDAVLASLARRRQADPEFTIEDAKGTLTHLYVTEGNDWLGRGDLQDAKLAAQIAAHEIFIHDWENEGEKKGE
jgi:hypothetical protein